MGLPVYETGSDHPVQHVLNVRGIHHRLRLLGVSANSFGRKKSQFTACPPQQSGQKWLAPTLQNFQARQSPLSLQPMPALRK